MRYSLLKYVILSVVLICMASLLTITATAHPFDDVPEWADEYVDEVYEFGYMNGTSETTFDAELPLTREQLVVTLYRISGSIVVSSDYFLKAKFADYADISPWARDAVQWAYREGITAGVNEKGTILFMPQKAVTRQEAAKFLVSFIEAFDYYAKQGRGAHIKDLTDVSPWALPYVEKCISIGIINGNENGSFNPEANATRVDAAKMIACLPEETFHVDRDFEYIAHRGLSGVEKENTCAAFIAAGEGNYYGIESDMWITKDGKFVMHHDQIIKAGGKEYNIIECTWEELKDIVLPARDGTYSRNDYKIPLLSDYINICRQYGKEAILEIKQREMTEEQIGLLIVELASLDYLENTTFISFNWVNCYNIRDALPDAKIMKLHEGVIETANVESLIKNNFSLAIRHDFLAKADVELMHEMGLQVNIWTCDSAYWAYRFASWGVDYVTTNILE